MDKRLQNIRQNLVRVELCVRMPTTLSYNWGIKTVCITAEIEDSNAHLHAGTVTLWTPNSPSPHVRLLAHLGPVTSVSIDPSSAGRYLATSGMDGKVKIWDCRNWKGCLRQWVSRASGAELDWSQQGMLSVASGTSVTVSFGVIRFQFTNSI